MVDGHAGKVQVRVHGYGYNTFDGLVDSDLYMSFLPAVEAHGVHFAFPREREVLQGIDLSVGNEIVALMGASGSGKTTLLMCLAGILVPSSGTIRIVGESMDGKTLDERSKIRRERLGMVFQFSELVAELTLVSNVALPLELLGTPARAAARLAQETMNELGIGALADRYPSQVSGGQAQRAAIARALIHEPAVIMADEPTGALDAENGETALDLLLAAARERGAAVVLVTHDPSVASHADRTIDVVSLNLSKTASELER